MNHSIKSVAFGSLLLLSSDDGYRFTSTKGIYMACWSFVYFLFLFLSILHIKKPSLPYPFGLHILEVSICTGKYI